MSVSSLEVQDLGYGHPHVNLAREEWLFRTSPPGTFRVLFYRNSPSILFGRNQNPWLECDIRECRRRNVVPARRISGGGTVYHDAGNLNYSFSMPRALYDPARFVGVVADALASMGFSARVCDRNSLWIGDRKVAGTAFMLTGKLALLHGCILIDTDLQALERLLKAPLRDPESRCVASVPSPVTRLADLIPEVTVSRVAEAITAAVQRHLGVPAVTPDRAGDTTDPDLQTCLDKQRSWDWAFGRTGRFEHALRAPRVPLIALIVDRGRVQTVRCSPPSPAFRELARAMTGLPYDGSQLSAAAEGVPLPHAVAESVGRLLKSQIP